MAYKRVTPISLSPESNNAFFENQSIRIPTLFSSSSVIVGSIVCPITTTDNNNGKLMGRTLEQPSSSRFIDLSPEQMEDVKASSSKKPKGRPIGSKNKSKELVVLNEKRQNLMEPILIKIPYGKDVVETLIDLARHQQVGITVRSGSGPVSGVTLLHPTTGAPTPPMIGTFDMISFSGTYINGDCHQVPPKLIAVPTGSSFSICFSGDRNEIFGGIIGGKIEAAGNVFITAALFKNPEFHRVSIINGTYQIDEGNPRDVGGVIPSVHHVVPESNNDYDIHMNDIDVGGINQQMLHPPIPTDVNFMQWNRSGCTDNY